MLGDKEGAAQGFAVLLGLMSGVATEQILVQVKLTFAESVGLDNPAAAQAAAEVADWIEQTGTYGLLASSSVLDAPVSAAEAG
jgi:hypothetical protein